MITNQLVYCRKTNTMVPLVRPSLQTPPKMQGSWTDDNTGVPKAVVESSKGVEGELGPNAKGYPQYYHIGGH